MVDSISAAASVVQGQKLDFSYLVKNLGTAAAGSHYAGINVDAAVDESHYVTWNTVNSLAGNGQATFTNSIDTAGLSVGQHTLYIKEDYWNNGVGESNETNNVKSITFNVTAPVPNPTSWWTASQLPTASGRATRSTSRSWSRTSVAPQPVRTTPASTWTARSMRATTAPGTPSIRSPATVKRTFTNSIDTAGLSVGQHTLYIKEDYWNNGVGESNESNNSIVVHVQRHRQRRSGRDHLRCDAGRERMGPGLLVDGLQRPRW